MTTNKQELDEWFAELYDAAIEAVDRVEHHPNKCSQQETAC